MRPILCFFSHKFFHKDFTGATYCPGYRIRCGIPAPVSEKGRDDG